MAWGKNGTTTLGSIGNSVEVSAIPDKKFYMFLSYTLKGSDTYTAPSWAFGSTTVDTGTNYAQRYSRDGAADSTGVNSAYMALWADPTNPSTPHFGVTYVLNIATEEKLVINHFIEAKSGAAAAPQRMEGVGKWVNTSNPIDIIKSDSKGGGSSEYGVGSNVSILGSD
jgi:hypothetical protein